jgi:hypothetical protein
MLLLLTAAAAAILRQNPASPYVLLPPGWRVDYFKGNDHQYAAILGPQGEEIRFPPYGAGVESAEAVHRRDPKAMYVAAFLGGRPVEATLTSDGSLTVSLRPRSPHEHASDAPMDYATKVATARQTTVALGVVLSRLGARARDLARNQYPDQYPDAPAPHRAVPGDPFAGEVSLPEGYAFRKEKSNLYRIGTFESPQGPPFSLWRMFLIDPGPWRTPKPGDGTWQETAPVLKGWLTVRSDAEGGLKAGFDLLPPKPRSAMGEVLVAASSTPQTVLATTFAALSYHAVKA